MIHLENAATVLKLKMSKLDSRSRSFVILRRQHKIPIHYIAHRDSVETIVPMKRSAMRGSAVKMGDIRQMTSRTVFYRLHSPLLTPVNLFPIALDKHALIAPAPVRVQKKKFGQRLGALRLTRKAW